MVGSAVVVEDEDDPTSSPSPRIWLASVVLVELEPSHSPPVKTAQPWHRAKHSLWYEVPSAAHTGSRPMWHDRVHRTTSSRTRFWVSRPSAEPSVTWAAVAIEASRGPAVSISAPSCTQGPSATCVIMLQFAKHRLWYSLPSSAQTSCRVPTHEATQLMKYS